MELQRTHHLAIAPFLAVYLSATMMTAFLYSRPGKSTRHRLHNENFCSVKAWCFQFNGSLCVVRRLLPTETLKVRLCRQASWKFSFLTEPVSCKLLWPTGSDDYISVELYCAECRIKLLAATRCVCSLFPHPCLLQCLAYVKSKGT